MKLVMFGADERDASPGVIVDDYIIGLEVEELGYPKSLEEIFELRLVSDISEYIETLNIKKNKPMTLLESYIASPLSGIGKIIACGLNYKNHAGEMGKPILDSPLIFSKANSSIAGHAEPLYLPDSSVSKSIDWEIELGVVIGATCSDVNKTYALNYVAGYTIALDITARDIQEREGQWFRAKSFDGFCPLGKYILTGDDFDLSDSIELSLSVNGEEKQRGRLDDMIFSVEEIISFTSRSMTLYPGDIILTGTPSGIGAGMNPPQFLSVGDKIKASISNLGDIEINVR